MELTDASGAVKHVETTVYEKLPSAVSANESPYQLTKEELVDSAQVRHGRLGMWRGFEGSAVLLRLRVGT